MIGAIPLEEDIDTPIGDGKSTFTTAVFLFSEEDIDTPIGDGKYPDKFS